jgi:hypothetical protein
MSSPYLSQNKINLIVFSFKRGFFFVLNKKLFGLKNKTVQTL